jgi:hypothetical protein
MEKKVVFMGNMVVFMGKTNCTNLGRIARNAYLSHGHIDIHSFIEGNE